ncbi:hypothetical protein TWF506_004729 [Arthrobotrys conoides]|uniref:HNH nuclease domain-containing protein n=1 Tax=Arthrobotrys conoides TaxID=74498 RepID=A0AAN8RI70_9PEZI
MEWEIVDGDAANRTSRYSSPNFNCVESMSDAANHDDLLAATEKRASGWRPSEKRKRSEIDSTPVRSSSSASSSKSELDVTSTVTFSDSIKIKSQRTTNNCCWLCGNSKSRLDVAHVIPKSNKEFQSDYQRGYFPFASLSSLENSIPLCTLCHDAFNHDAPYFSVVPTDLQYFIDFEQEDFNRRQGLLESPVRVNISPSNLRRIVPTGEMYQRHTESQQRRTEEVDGNNQSQIYDTKSKEASTKYVGGPYDVYLRVNYFPFTDISPGKFLYAQYSCWRGSPTAMIMHAMRNLTRGDGWMTMSRPVKRALDELQYLWSREPEPKA